DDLPIRREVAIFIALAPDNAKAQLCQRSSHGWQRPGAAYRAALTTDGEVIEIVASRLEPTDLDMHRVAKFGMGHGRALLRHLAHAFIGGDGPGDLHRLPWHTAAPLERSRRDLRPEHKAVRCRVTGSDTEREGVGGKNGTRPDATPEEAASRREQ